MEESWMSPVVFPSPLPRASSGSLLIAETRTAPAVGSHTSLTCHAACTATIRWFGGHSRVGFMVSVIRGGVVAWIVTFGTHLATFPEESGAVNLTDVTPSG